MNNLRRALAAPAILAVLAIVLASCSSVRATALEVNGHEYSQSSIDEELEAIAENPRLAERASTSDGTIDSSLTAAWLTTLVEDRVVEGELDRRGIRVTSADRAAAAAAASEFFGDTSVLEAFPKWFRDRITDRFAEREALLGEIGPTATDADIQAAYEEFLAAQRAQCPSGRFAAHILVDTREEAEAIAAQLAGGANFANLARERSTDTNSGSTGGELGCIDAQEYVPAFETAVTTQPLNQVSAPIQTEFGYHLIVVRDTIPLDAVEDLVRDEVDAGGSDAELGALTAKAKVSVDRRYGRWVVRDGVGRVEAPAGASSAPTTSP